MALVDVLEQLVQAHNQEDEDDEGDKANQNANAVGRLGSDDLASRSCGIPRNHEGGEEELADDRNYHEQEVQ